MTNDVKKSEAERCPVRVDEFLTAVEKKTADKTHRRLLRACRQNDPVAAIEAELKLIIEEILHES